MKRFYYAAAVIMTVFAMTSPVFGHHAMEYIEMESYRTARLGEFVLHIHFDYMVEDKNDSSLDHWEFTPGLSYGISDRLMLDVHTHFAKFGAGHVVSGEQYMFGEAGPPPFMEAMAMALQYRLTEGFFIDVAVSASVEIPFSRSKQLLGGRRGFEGMLILSKDFGRHSNVCANLKVGKDGDEGFEEWALGFRTPLSGGAHGLAAGVEVMGDFSGAPVSVLVGVYFPLGSENLVFKAGLQFTGGIGASRMNSTLMARY